MKCYLRKNQNLIVFPLHFSEGESLFKTKVSGIVIWYKATIHLTTGKCWQRTGLPECHLVDR